MDNSIFDRPPAVAASFSSGNDIVGFNQKQKTSKPGKNPEVIAQPSLGNKNKKNQKTMPKTVNDDVLSIQESFIEYLSIFQKGTNLHANQNLKQAALNRFEVLLLRMNDLIREAKRSGKDTGYYYDTSNLLARSVNQLKDGDPHNSTKEISSYLSAAVAFLDRALKG